MPVYVEVTVLRSALQVANACRMHVRLTNPSKIAAGRSRAPSVYVVCSVISTNESVDVVISRL